MACKSRVIAHSLRLGGRKAEKHVSVSSVQCIHSFICSESQVQQEFVRPRWPYDMRPSARAEKYISDAGPKAKTEVFLFWMFARKTVQL